TNGSTHWLPLDLRQMWNYLRAAELRARTFYVLPCPPYPVSEVSAASAALAPRGTGAVPKRALTRRPGHPWGSSQGCEHWFRVVPVLELWAQVVGHPMPQINAPSWPTPKRGSPPIGAPSERSR